MPPFFKGDFRMQLPACNVNQPNTQRLAHSSPKTMPLLLAMLLMLLAPLGSCGKKLDTRPHSISFVMTTPDLSLSMAAMKEATMGIAGCESGLKLEQTGTGQQQMELPQGETGCYGYLANFWYEGQRYESDTMSPETFAKGRSVHFFSRAVGKLIKVTVESQLADGSNIVAFSLRKARYVKFFPYDELPLANAATMGSTEAPLAIRLDNLSYKGMTSFGAPRFNLAFSCESIAETSSGSGQSKDPQCKLVAIDQVRVAIISRNEPHGNLEQLKATLATVELEPLPELPKSKVGRRLLFAKEAFAAQGVNARLLRSKNYLLVIVYNDAYHLYPFPLPTISYSLKANGRHSRR